MFRYFERGEDFWQMMKREKCAQHKLNTRFVARALVIRGRDRLLNHVWGGYLSRDESIPSFRFLVTRFSTDISGQYPSLVGIWPVSLFTLRTKKKRTDGVGVVAAHLGTRGAGWPRWWTCWKNWITPEWSLSRPRTRRVERTVSSEFIKLYIP